MAKYCIECNKKKKLFSINYAGLNVREKLKELFPNEKEYFANLHTDLILPGDKTNDYLCAECASKRQITCEKHGALKSKYELGSPPMCNKCMAFSIKIRFTGPLKEMIDKDEIPLIDLIATMLQTGLLFNVSYFVGLTNKRLIAIPDLSPGTSAYKYDISLDQINNINLEEIKNKKRIRIRTSFDIIPASTVEIEKHLEEYRNLIEFKADSSLIPRWELLIKFYTLLKTQKIEKPELLNILGENIKVSGLG